ncbi:hypothetical protein ACFPME_11365 [Rhodanobacter umsongensis]|uniref:Uncharacterized protein n=1 Tax=Rhodanobacter umsongensis TaxID=633153 RepID=A0ABW0JM60_9GAMM
MTKQPCTETAEDQGEIESSVLAYLHRHPQAADTLRGIVNWWLPQQRYESGCQRIERVLSELVARGVLRRDPLPHGDVLYALNRPAGPPQSP